MSITKTNTAIGTAGDIDSILAGKIIIRNHLQSDTYEVGAHVSASRQSDNLPAGTELFMVRPYIKPIQFIKKYCADYKVTLFHYKSSEYFKYKEQLEAKGVTCHFLEENTSLCKYTWELLNPNVRIPEVVKYVKDYITWTLDYDESKLFNYGMATIDNLYSQASTSTLIKLLDGDDILMGKVLEAGTQISERVNSLHILLAQELIFETEFEGIKTLAINAPRIESTVVEKYPGMEKFGLCMPFRKTFPYQNVMYGLYSLDANVDAGKLATAHDGGGSPGVGGFSSKEMLFEAKPVRTEPLQVVYSHLLRPLDAPEAVIKYETSQYQPKHYNVFSVPYKDEQVLIFNTPYLMRHSMWSKVRPMREQVGVTYCNRADGTVRVTAIKFDDTDPGEKFGELLGDSNYRIQILPSVSELGL